MIKHNFDQTPILLENFDQVIRSSEIRSTDPLSGAHKGTNYLKSCSFFLKNKFLLFVINKASRKVGFDRDVYFIMCLPTCHQKRTLNYIFYSIFLHIHPKNTKRYFK